MKSDETLHASPLLSGRRPLHVVAAYDEVGHEIVVVTVYHPDPDRWEDNRRRK